MAIKFIIGPLLLAFVTAPDAIAKAPDGCLDIQRKAGEALVLAYKLANRDYPKLIKAFREELSRRTLTHAQIKECAPQFHLIIAKMEQCVATGDTQCRFSQRESEEINKAPAVSAHQEIDKSNSLPPLLRYEAVLRLPHGSNDCTQGRSFGNVVIPAPIDFEKAIAELGREKVSEIVVLASDWLSSCQILSEDPFSFSDRRLIAMVIVNAALPTTAIDVDASTECESRLPQTYRNCSMSIDYSLENKTDDILFTHVAVACLGGLKKDAYDLRLANVHFEPVTPSESLRPHETSYFHIRYGVAHLRANKTQIISGGHSKWCHVLAASAERLSSNTTGVQAVSPPTSEPSGLTNETNEFLKDLLKNPPTSQR